MDKLKGVFLNKPSSCGFLFSRISEENKSLSSLCEILTSLHRSLFPPYFLFFLLVVFNIKIRMMQPRILEVTDDSR